MAGVSADRAELAQLRLEDAIAVKQAMLSSGCLIWPHRSPRR